MPESKRNFQDIMMALQNFWAEYGCLIWQPYYAQVGAGTMNPIAYSNSPACPRQIAPRRVRVPTLILWGMKDVALSHSMAQPSAELCDQGRLVLIENATHWVQHNEAEAVNQHLIEFLS